MSETENCGACGGAVRPGTTHFCAGTRQEPEPKKYVKLTPLGPETAPDRRDGGVFHIEAVEEVLFHDPSDDEQRLAIRIMFREFQGFAWWPSWGSTLILSQQFGDDFAKWIGRAVPIVNVPRRTPDYRTVRRFATIPPEDWEEALLAAHGVVGAQPSDVS